MYFANGENQGPERLSDLPRVTSLVLLNLRIKPQVRTIVWRFFPIIF